jgi:hypothetical protein
MRMRFTVGQLLGRSPWERANRKPFPSAGPVLRGRYEQAPVVGVTPRCATRWNLPRPPWHQSADEAGGCRLGSHSQVRARVAASVRLAAPSLPKTCLTCLFTVSRVTTSSQAMRWFDFPAAISCLHQARARHKTGPQSGHVQLGSQQEILLRDGNPGRGRRRWLSHRRSTTKPVALRPAAGRSRSRSLTPRLAQGAATCPWHLRAQPGPRKIPPACAPSSDATHRDRS